MPPGLAKEWFIRGDGIDRHVISSDIQRYLGNDATVRPGVGTGPDQGVKGYWVKAYRNLTTAMVDDLRASTLRWQTEQRKTGTRDHYVDSEAFTQAGNRMPSRPAGDSPLGAMDPRYQDMQPGRGGRIPDRLPDRMPMDDRMSMDPPYAQPGPGRFPPDRGDRHPGDSRPFQQGGPGFPPHDRDPRDRGSYDGPDYGRNMPYNTDMRDPRDAGRGDPRDPRGAPGFPQINGIPPDYGRQQDFYGAGPNNNINNNYGGPPPPPMNALPRGHDPSMNSGPQFGAAPGPPRNDVRDPRYGAPPNNYGSDMRDPRDPRYAYPSPAQSTVDPRDNLQSPAQHNNFGHNGPPQGNMNPQFDQYGGRPPPLNQMGNNNFANPQGPPGVLPGTNPNTLPGARPRPNQGNIGQRPSASPADMGLDPRDPRRRRLQ